MTDLPSDPKPKRRRRKPRKAELLLVSLLEDLANHHAPTYDHCRRVASLCRQAALKAGWSRDQVHAAFAAGLVHDLGHLETPRGILVKESALDEGERLVVSQHPQVGVRLLQHAELAPEVVEAVACHHAQPDGGGYPVVTHHASPLTHLVAAASTFDSILFERWSSAVRPRELALQELQRVAGSQLTVESVAMILALFGDAPATPTG